MRTGSASGGRARSSVPIAAQPVIATGERTRAAWVKTGGRPPAKPARCGLDAGEHGGGTRGSFYVPAPGRLAYDFEQIVR
jgi:hypothetical protein